MQASGPAPARAPSTPAAPIKLSALPGVQRKPLEVSMADLVRRFPQVAAATLQRAQGVLAGISLENMTSASWLSFGMPVQNELAGLVKLRLAAAQQTHGRAGAQHLARMQVLLTDVLEAFEGGFLRKSPEKVWADHRPEVEQLETLLRRAGDELVQQMQGYAAMKAPAQSCGETLETTALAAEYLLDLAPPESGGLLVARVTSMTGSQAVLKEHLLYLEQDITNLQELMTLVQDGVLLKLPAVYTQLAGLAGKPTETQRFLATEKLTDLLHTIKQGKP
jgi:hypothetical protein